MSVEDDMVQAHADATAIITAWGEAGVPGHGQPPDAARLTRAASRIAMEVAQDPERAASVICILAGALVGMKLGVAEHTGQPPTWVL